jgi:hypothetical protein
MSFIYTVDSLIITVTGAGQCVYDALDGTIGGQPQRYCPLTPGTIAWDDCHCGQLTQTIMDVGPSNTFPVIANDTKIRACGPPFIVARVNMSLTRCVPLPNDRGHPPSCTALQNAAIVLETDRYTMRTALICCLQDKYDTYQITDFAVNVAATVGPEGACAGVDLVYMIGMTNPCCS